MSASAALALVVAGMLAAASATYLALAARLSLWPFRESYPEESEPRACGDCEIPDPYRTVGGLTAPATCGLVCEGGSERRACVCRGPAQCPYRAETRHGDDGNSGHG